MRLVRLRAISEVKSMVTLVHYQPDLLNETEKVDSIFVDSIPGFVPQAGKTAELFYNPDTKEFFYEYRDVPTTENERITQLEKENDELKKSNFDTQEAILELYEVIMGTPTT